MAIRVELDVMMARRKVRLNDLAEAVGITPQNLSVLKTGKAKAIRFSTLEAICRQLDCTPGDILVYEADEVDDTSVLAARRFR
jgi:putative transcriptional regulator